MNELNVIVDISGSMYSLGKPAVIGTLLATFASLPPDCGGEAELKKYSWDGSSESLESLLSKTEGKPTLLVSDGFAVSDCCSGREIRNKILSQKDMLFLVLCGADAFDVSVLKDFKGLRSVSSDNVLFAVETLIEHSSDSSSDSSDTEDW